MSLKKYQLGRGVLYSSHEHLNIVGYSDTNWPGSIDGLHSTFSNYTFVEGKEV